jgi:hypothetical protein
LGSGPDLSRTGRDTGAPVVVAESAAGVLLADNNGSVAGMPDLVACFAELLSRSRPSADEQERDHHQ